VGRDYPLSIEKLCPVLSWYVVTDWRAGCERCIQILRYGGMGHTMSIHSKNEEVILQFGLRKPAFRICVNTPTTHGSIGLTTGLDPAMTLGCGGWGGNITSDNISPRHLLNIKRLAYEVRPAAPSATMASLMKKGDKELPTAPPAPAPAGISAATLASKIDAFLSSRGYKPPESAGQADLKVRLYDRDGDARSADARSGGPSGPPSETPAEFICEDDVRTAIRLGRQLVVGEKTIITPSARDLGEARSVFVQAAWPR
jgi:acetaldehyde dehydrogenase (acetylating)